MTVTQLQSGIESVLFAGAEPVSVQRLAEVFEVEKEMIVKVLQQLQDHYDESGSGISLSCAGGRYQLTTKLENAAYVKKALDIRRNVPLSQASLEVLAVIAYNQPVTKAFVEQVRGVDSSGVIGTLIEKDLVEEACRLDLPGRPIAYQVTDHFLRCFSMDSIGQLPPLPKDQMAGNEHSPIEQTLQKIESIEPAGMTGGQLE